jgi:NADH:ubiquinone oxidoreductase subunit 2 (subunit N)
VLGLLLSLNFFSLAGIPPLLGFYSKFFVYLSLMDSQYYFLTFVIAILTIFSTFYYVRLVTLVFFLPSMRSIFSVFFSAASNVASYLTRPAHLPILHLAIVLALVNISFFVHFDYLIFLVTKFCFLLF